MPDLSIITVNLNNAKGLEATIKSVAAQSSKEAEFLVIDGDSKDNSVEIIKKYESEISWWVSEKDGGIYQAMNKGIQKATGKYLLFLNSGDRLNNNDVVKTILPELKQYDVISGDIEIYDKGQWHKMSSEDHITVEHFLRLNLYHQATFIARSLFEKYGLYNETFRIGGDYEFFIRTLLNKGASYHHVSQTISNFVTDGISNDKSMLSCNMEERERAWELNFSGSVVNDLKEHHRLVNSAELKWGRRVNKYLLRRTNKV